MAKRKKIGLQEKARILEESYKAGCIITELARKYKISSGVLYRWRTRNKKISNGNGRDELSVTNSEFTSGSRNKFVEVTVSDAGIEQEADSNSFSSVLQKALLEYENFTITVEGSQGMRVLPEIMKMMEKVA